MSFVEKVDNDIPPLPEIREGVAALPQPPDFKTIFLGGIFIILFLTALYHTSEIVIPVVLAFVLKLVFQPVLRFLQYNHIPSFAASALIIVALLSSIIGLGTMLSGPAVSWGEKIPASLPQMQERLRFISKPVEQTQKILVQAEDLTKVSGTKVMPVAIQGNTLSDKIFTGTQIVVTGLFTTMLILFFFLASGDTFLRRLVEILPRFKDKRQAVDISQQIEKDISRYLLTITSMNLLVGIATAFMMWILKVDDPILWGTLAFLLNYIPIIGPFICFATFFFVGFLVIDNSWMAFMPAVSYIIIHFIEGSIFTPMLLAKRFTLNPVLVIVSLIFWYWMWGGAGAVLAMPMLAITKIICDRIERLAAVGHFLGG